LVAEKKRASVPRAFFCSASMPFEAAARPFCRNSIVSRRTDVLARARVRVALAVLRALRA
jgi:hypothetical protein